jgi:hypothetical protein
VALVSLAAMTGQLPPGPLESSAGFAGAILWGEVRKGGGAPLRGSGVGQRKSYRDLKHYKRRKRWLS